MENSNSFGALLTSPALKDEIDAEMAVRSLRAFVLQAWTVLEPSTPFVPGWHIDAIIEHLEAVSFGHIRRTALRMEARACDRARTHSIADCRRMGICFRWPPGNSS